MTIIATKNFGMGKQMPPKLAPLRRNSRTSIVEKIQSGEYRAIGLGNDFRLEITIVESSKEEFMRSLKELHTRMDHALGTPSLLKGPDSKKYVQFPYKPSIAPKPIPKRFRMSDIPV